MAAKYLLTLFVAILPWVTAQPLSAADTGPAVVQAVSVETFWSSAAAHQGDRRTLAVRLTIADGYHINPARADLDDQLLIPTGLAATDVPGSLDAGETNYPPPTLIAVGPTDQPSEIPGYSGTLTLYWPATVRKDAAYGRHEVGLELTYQACTRTLCLPPVTIPLSTSLEVVPVTTMIDKTTDPARFPDLPQTTALPDQDVHLSFFKWSFDLNTGRWPGYLALLLLAGVGGFLLNATPCVLPIIPIKVMGLRQAAQSRGQCLVLGGSTSIGIVTFWLLLGVAMAAISTFTSANQLYQYPAFPIGMGVVIAWMALGMCGLFTFQLPRWATRWAPKQTSITGSFAVGVMMAVLSTPCTGPFMGSAATWAVGQDPATTLTVFAGIGVGMACPYLLLATFPRLIERIPRSGPIGDVVKQMMGLLMLAAAAYFIGVGVSSWAAVPGEPPSRSYWWGPIAVCVVAAAWLIRQAWRLSNRPMPRAVVAAASAGFIVVATLAGLILTDTGPVRWVYYTPQRFAQARNERRVIVVDFTAEWCLNCRVLEESVLSASPIVERLNRPEVVPMKVDLTSGSPDARSKLKEAGSVAIPLLVVYARDGTPVFKSEAYTVAQLSAAIDLALGNQRP